MITAQVREKYLVTIGIECHVQLKTKTKLFAAVANDAREAEPNTLVSHICFGLPGALPVLNREAVRLAAKAAYALGTVPQPFSQFDRKHYFYPDLPKGYQITQLDHPIILGGAVHIDVDGEPRVIGITRAHIEEDAGKSTHPEGKDYSLVDLNRAGTPLIEIVSEPDMHSAAEAKAYARELYLRMKYAGVSEANLYYGNMRFDVNTSVSPDFDSLGTRTETKNLNSFRAVEKAVEYEVTRQIELLERGERIVQETRGWNDAKQRTFSQRSKEDSQDYRYFPDPDVPPVVLSAADISEIAASMPVLPHAWRERLAGIGLDAPTIETLLEANIEDGHAAYLADLEASLTDPTFAKQLANWTVNQEIPLMRSETPPTPLATGRVAFYRAVYDLLADGKLSSTNAKALIGSVLQAGTVPTDVAAQADSQGLIQQSDEAAIEAIVQQVLTDNPKAADDVRAGETKAIGFLTGQVMKASKGQANPSVAQAIIKKQLGLG